MFTVYLNALREESETIRSPLVFGHDQPVRLDKIYIPLDVSEKKNTGRSIGGEISGNVKKHEDWQREARQTEKQADVIEDLRKYRYVVITGPAGCGKSTLVQYLVLQICRENTTPEEPGIIPVPIVLREFGRVKVGLRDHISEIFEKYGAGVAGKQIEKALIQGRFALLLDGYDEIFPTKKNEKVVREICGFIKKYPTCPVLITCRDAVYQNELKDFTRLEIQEFDGKRINRFIHSRFGPVDRDRTDAMTTLFSRNKDIEAFARNPLMLALITTFYDRGCDVRQKRCHIYKRIIDAFLSEWDSQKKTGNRFSAHAKATILKKLAFRNHSRQRQSFTEREILAEIEGQAFRLGFEKGESRAVLEEIRQRSYILRKLFKGSYDFRHLPFQHYFTALELVEHEDGIDILQTHFSDPWWEEPILLYAGGKADAAPLIERIRKSKPEDIFYSNLILSGKCIAEAEHTDSFLKEEITRETWHLINTSNFQLLKERAIAVLARLRPPFIIDELVDQLTEREPGVRRFAAEALGLIGTSDVLPSLLMTLIKDTDSTIRSQAASALGEIGSTEAIQPLIRVLGSDNDGDVRRSAAAALGTIGRDEALPALFKSLASDPDSNVRGGAAEAIGKIENPEAIFRLSLTLSTEKESAVRWRTALALGRLRGSDSRDILIEALSNDKDKEVRESAAEGLAHIGSAKCVAALIKALSFDSAADVRGSAAFALGQIKSKEALPTLIRALITDNNGEVRGRAAFALGRLKNTEAIPYLVATFNTHKESMIRGNATYALGEIGGAEAIPFLIQALTLDKDSYVRYRAAEVLGSVGDMVTVQPLKIALQDEGSYYGWRVKDKAYEALEKISKRFHIRITRTANKGE